MAKKILIVDDSVSIRQILSLTLKGAGYEVVEAQDGKEALDKLGGGIVVDLIICDVNMPHVDGITMLKTIKADSKYEGVKFTPIIMLTTESQESKKREGRDAGARAWIVKPFLPDQLLQAVSKFLD